jgi:hypothetical protein
MRADLILGIMNTHRPAPFDSEASNDLARTTRSIPLAIPLAAALIRAMVVLVWSGVLA